MLNIFCGIMNLTWFRYQQNHTINDIPSFQFIIVHHYLRITHESSLYTQNIFFCFQIPKHLGLKTKKFAVDKLFNTEDVLMNPHIVVTKNGENLPGLTQFLLETPVKKVDRYFELHCKRSYKKRLADICQK